LARLAEGGNAQAHRLPRPLMHSADLDFSFAGLKTAVSVQMQKMLDAKGVALFADLPESVQRDFAASTQAAIVEVLVHKSMAALKSNGLKRLVVAGGVGANQYLRNLLNAAAQRYAFRVHYPELELCTDNGAMIAMAAAMRLASGQEQAVHHYGFEVKPRWPLDGLHD